MIKQIKQYSGYYGCDKCDQRGEWLGRLAYQDVMTWIYVQMILLDDRSIRNIILESLHSVIYKSIWSKVSLLTTCTKYVWGLWRNCCFCGRGGDRSVKHSQQQINLISERLINMSKNIHLFLHGNHDLWVKLTDGRLPSFDNFSYTLEFWLWMVSWSQKCINILWYYLLQCQFLYAPNSPKIMQIMPASFFSILYPEAVSYMVRSFWFIMFIQCSTLEKKFDNMAP